MVHVRTEIRRVSPETIQAFQSLASATVHEAAGKKGYISCRIRALAPGMRICGPAFTVECAPGDNSMMHKALERARPGDVLVATVAGAEEYGYWGDLMTVSAMAKRLGGLCIEGCIRDSAEIIASGFPVFSTGRCIRGTGKGVIGLINYPIFFGGTRIEPGDLILGDDDGLVAVPREDCPRVLENAVARCHAEIKKAETLATGVSSVEYNKMTGLFEAAGLEEDLR
jgi:4-hydroxy-4-methyl-2-oxoglutarate aldolase